MAKKKKGNNSKGSSSQSSMGEQGQKSSESGDAEAVVSSEIDSNDEVDPPFTPGGNDTLLPNAKLMMICMLHWLKT